MNNINCINNQNIKVPGLNENSPRFNINNNELGLKLMPHQLALIHKMMMVENTSIKSPMPFGLLSDKTGAGKTYVVLAFIYLSVKMFNQKGLNIIVIQHNLYTQWVRAINTLLGNLLEYKCITENSKVNSLYGNPHILNNFNFILITPILYESFIRTISSMNIHIKRIFFDEADTMTNLLFNCLKADMTWFISATIASIFDSNTLSANIGSYKLYLPNLMKNECYCDADFINKIIMLPKLNSEIFLCKDFYLDNILIFLLNKEQIINVNSHNYAFIKNECNNSLLKNKQDVVKQMYKFCIRKIIDCDALIKELTRSKSNKNELKFETTSKRNFYKNRYDMMNTISNKYNLCIDCFSHIPTKCYKSSCKKLLCSDCYNSKYNLMCIDCSKVHDWELSSEINEISPKLLEHIEDGDKDKFYFLTELLPICGKKTIIYCHGNNGVGLFLRTYCFDNDCLFEELNGGNFKEIDRILNEFRTNDAVKFLLIDDPYFIVGLNLEFVTDIVFFHQTDIKTKNQLVGRSQRLGRINSLNVWFIYYVNEV
jgi:hypothetical protein